MRLVTTLLAALLLAACGVDGPPEAPERTGVSVSVVMRASAWFKR
jgi:predicted small lipoprotein YifL